MTRTVIVDFFAYTWPGQMQWLDSMGHTTLGNFLLPMLGVRGPRGALPATRGAVAGDEFLSGYLSDRGAAGDPADARSGERAQLAELFNGPKTWKAEKVSKRIPKSAVIAARPWKPDKFLALRMPFGSNERYRTTC